MPVAETHVRSIAHEVHELVGVRSQARVILAHHPHRRLQVREAARAALEAGGDGRRHYGVVQLSAYEPTPAGATAMAYTTTSIVLPAGTVMAIVCGETS